MSPQRMDLILRLRQRGISDLAVLRAIEKLPRQDFAGVTQLDRAYGDLPLPLPCGQTMLSPFITAVMAQALNVRSEQRILLVGAGSGYIAALLAQMGARVFAIERYKALAEVARENMQALDIHAVTINHGDGVLGWAEKAPFDGIFIAGRVQEPAPAWTEQLTASGQIVMGLGGRIVRCGQDGVFTDIWDETLPQLLNGVSKAL